MQKVKIRPIVGYCSIGLFSLLILSFIFPIANSSSAALDNTSTSASSRLTIKAVETVSVRLASQVTLDLEPKSSGSFGVAQTELGVTTNDPEGFEVFLSTSDREAALRGASDKISTIGGSMVGESFNGNTWGYSLGKELPSMSSIYHPVPATSSLVLKTSTATIDTEAVYHLGFGVHITPSLPAGEYSTSVLLSVVANPATISSLQDLVYMQDMTSDICSNTYPTTADLATMTETEKTDAKLHPITKQLYDIRDGKQYWVAKLADGNCWMTQNLALVITEEMINTTGNTGRLNSETTDIGYDSKGNLIDGVKYWNQESVVPPLATTIDGGEGASSYTLAKSWNRGNATYGSYFTFSAATAGSGAYLEDAVAPDSICAKGWKLPESGITDVTVDKTFLHLFTAYDAWGDVEEKNMVTTGPLNFKKGGDFRGSLTDMGGGGYYWTSDSVYDAGARGLYINAGGYAQHVSASEKKYGKTVRCVAR